jgi:hypothetical protein
LAVWSLKRELCPDSSSFDYSSGYIHFADIIKANAWLQRHRLAVRIAALQARRQEGAAFVKAPFEGDDAGMGGLTGR